MKKDYKAIIVEGEAREVGIIGTLKKVFFQDEKSVIITLPAGQNIYMLWKRLKEDEFETDIIEVLRESDSKIRENLEGIERENFSEVFLFFDYDAHQRNISGKDGNIVEMMLESFDNETENGKLYISYPMVEALRDFDETEKGNREEWFYKISDYANYRSFSARRNRNLDFRKYSPEIWYLVICSFIEKISFMWDVNGRIGFKDYRKNINPFSVYQVERSFKDKVLVLSAFPEFLLDYFPESFWNKAMKKGRMLF